MEYQPPANNPTDHGMGPWVQPRAPEPVLPAGTVTAPLPPLAPGSAKHPVGTPEK
jgi:hypothetical protein